MREDRLRFKSKKLKASLCFQVQGDKTRRQRGALSFLLPKNRMKQLLERHSGWIASREGLILNGINTSHLIGIQFKVKDIQIGGNPLFIGRFWKGQDIFLQGVADHDLGAGFAMVLSNFNQNWVFKQFAMAKRAPGFN